MKCLYYLIFITLFQVCSCQNKIQSSTTKPHQDSIIKKYMLKARSSGIYSQAYQKSMDTAIKEHPEIAYFWQQKAMPLIKMGKDELAMPLLDEAVKLDEERYLDYRAFIKCIFSRSYKDAIKDFKLCKTKFGNSYVMDHSYDFYIALCKIQLNQFEEAEKILKQQVEKDITKKGKDWVHFTEYFYLGISLFEQDKYTDALKWFNLAIDSYTEFPEANYYKSLCLRNLGKTEEAKEFYDLFQEYKGQGFTINESNSQYIKYPYQF